jgi:hypothetical protein
LNILPYSLYTRLSPRPALTPVHFTVAGANGDALVVRGQTQFTISASGGNVLLDAVVVESTNPILLLGTPFCRATHAVVDFRNNRLVTDIGSGPWARNRIEPHVEAGTGPAKLALAAALQPDAEELPSLPDTPLLSDTERLRFEAVMDAHRPVWHTNQIGEMKGFSHHIELTTNRPVRDGPRRFTPEKAAAIRAEVKKMLDLGVIEHCVSPYACYPHLVLKPDTSFRFCLDYRPLNDVTVDDLYPLPRGVDLLRDIKGSRYFVSLDLRAGYWQIPVAPEDRAKTAFVTPDGHYQFVRMPFGLKNAPATFQRAMDTILDQLRGNGVLVYLDDVLIHAESFDRCLALLDDVLRRFADHNVTVRMAKCEFFPKSVQYLGHEVAQGEIRPLTRKVAAIRALAPPSDIKGVRRVLGLFTFYQWLIKDFARLAEPLYAMTRKDAFFDWDTDCQTAFDALKDGLIDATLATPLDGEQLQLETDASEHAVGAVLSVLRDGQWHPVEFASRVLQPRERAWIAREREAFAIVFGLHKFDEYVRGREIRVVTDHHNLLWLTEAKKGKLYNWRLTLSEYHFRLYHKNGSEIPHADCLSRDIPPDFIEARMICAAHVEALPQPRLPTTDQLRAAQRLDPLPNADLHDGLQLAHNRIVVPASLVTQVVEYYHSAFPHTHKGVRDTVHRIRRLFWWNTIRLDVHRYIKACPVCARFRGGRSEAAPPIQGTHPRSGPFATLFIDLWGPNQQVATPILTMLDMATRWVEAVALPDKSAATISDAIITHWVCRYGCPRRLISDNEPTFTSDIVDNLCRALWTKHVTSSPYHPQGNGILERWHRHLKFGLAHRLDRQPTLPLARHIAETLFAYRTSLHSALNDTPAFVLYGFDPRLPDESWGARQLPADQRLDHFLDVRDKISRADELRRLQRTAQRNEAHRDVPLAKGDLVAARTQALDGKLDAMYRFPCRVDKVTRSAITLYDLRETPRKLFKVHRQHVRLVGSPLTAFQRLYYDSALTDNPASTPPGSSGAVT